MEAAMASVGGASARTSEPGDCARSDTPHHTPFCPPTTTLAAGRHRFTSLVSALLRRHRANWLWPSAERALSPTPALPPTAGSSAGQQSSSRPVSAPTPPGPAVPAPRLPHPPVRVRARADRLDALPAASRAETLHRSGESARPRAQRAAACSQAEVA
eukprot:scaffold15611_cov110-Isochrysis_galbana.AAC.6